MINFDITKCTVCPRECGINRYTMTGRCSEGAVIRIAKTMLHHFEEPCISGTDPDCGSNPLRGSGAIFFSGCPLGCVYCQNKDISGGGVGREMSPAQLADEMLRLENIGAYNINLVSPTQFVPQIIEALDIAKLRLSIPVVFNTGGYEKASTVAKLSGYADIFLTDFKYGTSDVALKYSDAPDYPRVAAAALTEMLRIVGVPQYSKDGMLRRGVIMRHLVLPGGRHDSIEALRLAAKAVNPGDVILSLMSQYTPEFAPDSFKKLKRRITSFEYNSVLDEAISLGFDGYMQDKASATSSYTPDFK